MTSVNHAFGLPAINSPSKEVHCFHNESWHCHYCRQISPLFVSWKKIKRPQISECCGNLCGSSPWYSSKQAIFLNGHVCVYIDWIVFHASKLLHNSDGCLQLQYVQGIKNNVGWISVVQNQPRVIWDNWGSIWLVWLFFWHILLEKMFHE